MERRASWFSVVAIVLIVVGLVTLATPLPAQAFDPQLALALANALAPMPTLIAADRSAIGTLGLMASGSAGALLFGLLGRRVRYRARPTPPESP